MMPERHLGGVCGILIDPASHRIEMRTSPIISVPEHHFELRACAWLMMKAGSGQLAPVAYMVLVPGPNTEPPNENLFQALVAFCYGIPTHEYQSSFCFCGDVPPIAVVRGLNPREGEMVANPPVMALNGVQNLCLTNTKDRIFLIGPDATLSPPPQNEEFCSLVTA